MPEVLKFRWMPDQTSGLPRRDRRGCDYEAYVPDRVAGQAFLLRAETATDVAELTGWTAKRVRTAAKPATTTPATDGPSAPAARAS